MTARMPNRPPQRLALLSDRDAIRHLTAAVLQEEEDLPQHALGELCTPFADDPRWDADPVRDLVDEAMERFTETPTRADAWLAPRLHAALRATRREAADSGLWNFLAMCLAPDYVFWRHPARVSSRHPVPQANPTRFNGAFHSQAFARLWWAAELFRNGADYRPVEIACANQDILNTVLRLEIIYHRPTAQAFVRLLERGIVRTGRDINALAQAVNIAGSTLFFEALAPDDGPRDADSYRSWMSGAGDVFIQYESLPEGPDDGTVLSASIDVLIPLFETLFGKAPVRGRETVRRPTRSEAIPTRPLS